MRPKLKPFNQSTCSAQPRVAFNALDLLYGDTYELNVSTVPDTTADLASLIISIALECCATSDDGIPVASSVCIEAYCGANQQ